MYIQHKLRENFITKGFLIEIISGVLITTLFLPFVAVLAFCIELKRVI